MLDKILKRLTFFHSQAKSLADENKNLDYQFWYCKGLEDGLGHAIIVVEEFGKEKSDGEEGSK